MIKKLGFEKFVNIKEWEVEDFKVGKFGNPETLIACKLRFAK